MPSIRMSRATVGMLVIALVLWGVPAFAAKVAISEAELDAISAAGEPTVITTGSGSSTVDYTSQPVFTMAFDVPNAQSGLSALTIQNVVGELQLLVNLNVLSAVNQVAGTEQRNFSMQSWGATLPIADTVKTVEGVAAAPCLNADSCNTSGGNGGTAGTSTGGIAGAASSGAGGAGGTGGAGGAGGSGSPSTAGAGGSANGGNAAAAPGGNGGTASSPAGNGGSGAPNVAIGNGATSPGVISPAASASGDLVITTGDGAKVKATDQPVFTLAFTASEAQKDLSALFISNVVGRSQFALNLNIASAAFTTVPFASNPIEGNVTGVIKQVNTGIQFRGTPITGSTTIGITHTN